MDSGTPVLERRRSNAIFLDQPAQDAPPPTYVDALDDQTAYDNTDDDPYSDLEGSQDFSRRRSDTSSDILEEVEQAERTRAFSGLTDVSDQTDTQEDDDRHSEVDQMLDDSIDLTASFDSGFRSRTRSVVTNPNNFEKQKSVRQGALRVSELRKAFLLEAESSVNYHTSITSAATRQARRSNTLNIRDIFDKSNGPSPQKSRSAINVNQQECPTSQLEQSGCHSDFEDSFEHLSMETDDRRRRRSNTITPREQGTSNQQSEEPGRSSTLVQEDASPEAPTGSCPHPLDPNHEPREASGLESAIVAIDYDGNSHINELKLDKAKRSIPTEYREHITIANYRERTISLDLDEVTFFEVMDMLRKQSPTARDLNTSSKGGHIRPRFDERRRGTLGRTTTLPTNFTPSPMAKRKPTIHVEVRSDDAVALLAAVLKEKHKGFLNLDNDTVEVLVEPVTVRLRQIGSGSHRSSTRDGERLPRGKAQISKTNLVFHGDPSSEISAPIVFTGLTMSLDKLARTIRNACKQYKHQTTQGHGSSFDIRAEVK